MGSTLGSAIGGLGSGLISTIIFNGIGSLVEASFSNGISSVGDVFEQFIFGGTVGGAMFAFGLGEVNHSLSLGGSSLDFQLGIDKIGLGISWSNEAGTAREYGQVYINTIEAALVVIAIYMPQLLPGLLGYAYAAG